MGKITSEDYISRVTYYISTYYVLFKIFLHFVTNFFKSNSYSLKQRLWGRNLKEDHEEFFEDCYYYFFILIYALL